MSFFCHPLVPPPMKEAYIKDSFKRNELYFWDHYIFRLYDEYILIYKYTTYVYDHEEGVFNLLKFNYHQQFKKLRSIFIGVKESDHQRQVNFDILLYSSWDTECAWLTLKLNQSTESCLKMCSTGFISSKSLLSLFGWQIFTSATISRLWLCCFSLFTERPKIYTTTSTNLEKWLNMNEILTSLIELKP